jgi:hypothetical protein
MDHCRQILDPGFYDGELAQGKSQTPANHLATANDLDVFVSCYISISLSAG